MPENSPLRSFRITVPGPPGGSAVRAVEALLAAEGYAFEPEPFWDRARVLIREPSPLGHSLAARLGLVYIQDRSSMLPPLALLPEEGEGFAPGGAVLDMCAAPGSKTGMLSFLAGPQGLVLACEPSPDRLAVLRAVLGRTQAVNTATVRAAGERLVLGGCDEGGPGVAAILLDPPCSGWGTTDKHPRARELWTGERVEPMLRLQRALLKRAAGLLAPGGRLVYSTCTSNPDENEAQVRFARDELGLALRSLSPPPGVALEKGDLPGVLRVALEPGQQGFFVAALAKPEQAMRPDRRPDHEKAFKGTARNGPTRDHLARDQRDPHPSDHLAPDHDAWPGRPLDQSLDADLPLALDFSGLGPGQVRVFGGPGSHDRGSARGRGGKSSGPGKALAVFVPARAAQYLDPAGPWQGTVLGRVAGDRFLPESQARALLPPEPGPGSLELGLEELRALASGASLRPGLPDGPLGVYWRGLAVCWAFCRSGRVLAAIR